MTICHRDIHLLRGELGRDVPMLAGHEAVPALTEGRGTDYAVVTVGSTEAMELG